MLREINMNGGVYLKSFLGWYLNFLRQIPSVLYVQRILENTYSLGFLSIIWKQVKFCKDGQLYYSTMSSAMATFLVHSNYLPLSIRGATISLASEFKTGVKTRRLKLGSCLNPSSFTTCLTPVDLFISLQYLSCQCFGTITIHVSRIYEVP